MGLRDWLAGLGTEELRRLLAAVRGGRVRPGASRALLIQLGLPGHWSEPLEILAAGGWTAATLAEALAWGVQERERSDGGRLHLVSTDPGIADAGFVGTAVVLRQLFKRAEREVLIAGFRVTDRGILECLRRPDAGALDVRMFLDLDPSVDAHGRKRPPPWPPRPELPGRWWREFVGEVWPEALDPPRAWYSPLTLGPDEEGAWRSMHIKSVVIDRHTWLVTSANLTDRGQYRNLELGAVVEDATVAERVIRHFELWVEAGVMVEFPE
ncbi:phospholipase D-like domain-containing protein [Myxococcota bacterium]|nr:phospholipase D-like domain-containing protein [Myxococcota bacterium]